MIKTPRSEMKGESSSGGITSRNSFVMEKSDKSISGIKSHKFVSFTNLIQ